jgi:4-hydroxyphenylpyruvate dioxygenase
MLRSGVIGGGIGDLVHALVGRDDSQQVWEPGCRPIGPGWQPAGGWLTGIDSVHAVVSRQWAGGCTRFYVDVLGFRPVRPVTAPPAVAERSVTLIRPVVTGGPPLKLIVVWPATGQSGPADEFLHYHDGAGIALVEFTTDDIQAAVQGLRKRGVRFLSAPQWRRTTPWQATPTSPG